MKYLQLLLKPFSIGLFITILFCAVSFQYYSDSEKVGLNEVLNLIHLKSIDLRLNARGAEKPAENIALLAIDNKSVDEIGRWPWPRKTFAQILDKSIDYGAKAIGIDVIFSEPSDHPTQSVYNKLSPELDEEQRQKLKSYVQSLDNDYFLSKSYEKNKDKIVMGIIATDHFQDQNHKDLCNKWINDISNEKSFFDREAFYIGVIDPVPFDFPQTLKEVYLEYLRAQNDPYAFCDVFLDYEKDPVLVDLTPQWEALREQIPEFQDFKTTKELAKHYKQSYTHNTIPRSRNWILNTEQITPDKDTNSGHFNAEIDADGVIRFNHLFTQFSDYLVPSIGLKTFLLSQNYSALVNFKLDPKTEFKQKIIDKVDIINSKGEPLFEIPLSTDGKLLLNYRGPQKTIPHISVSEVLSESDTAEIETIHFNEDGTVNSDLIEIKTVNKKEWFKDRIFILGASALAIYDLRVTPFDRNMPGPETHLNVIDNLLRQDFLKIHKDEEMYMPLSLFFIGVLASLVISYLGAVSGFFTTIIMLATVLIVDKHIFFLNGWVVTIIFPLILILSLYIFMTFYKYFTEERSKKELRGTFSKYVSPSIVDEILKDPENLELGGKKQNMTVLFSDIRGFTTISEMLDPKALSELLNSYLTPMTELVFEHKGTLDKYMGDAVMAFFGAPVQYPDHAAHACRCALSHIKKLKELQIEYEKKGLPQIDIGIGINTGEMSVGNMGSETVRSYTVMGDAVNLGSRLEGINKEYGTRIIISEFTYQDVKDSFICREIDWVRVKGKNKPVKIFELIDEGSTSVENAKMLKHFNKGFELYHQKMWTEAIEQFNLALNHVPEDVPSKLYIQRCETFIKQPPPEDWDGVYVMTTK